MSLKGYSELEGLFGVFGKELAAQFRVMDVEGDWERAHRADMLHAEDLGIGNEELVGHRAALEKHKGEL